MQGVEAACGLAGEVDMDRLEEETDVGLHQNIVSSAAVCQQPDSIRHGAPSAICKMIDRNEIGAW